jgi:hypothetical protein
VSAIPTNGTNISWTPGIGSLTANLTNEVAVINGGTGINSTTAYGVLCGGTTAIGNFQNTGAGVVGQFLKSNGVSNLPTWQSSAYGYIYLESNVSVTIIAVANTYYKVLGVTISGISSLFSFTSNRMQYIGTSPINVSINASLNFTLSGGGTSVTFVISRNAIATPINISAPVSSNSSNPAVSISISCLSSLVTNDYIEIWATCGANGRNLTVNNMNFVVSSL